MHGEMNFPTTFTVKFLKIFFLEEWGKQVIYCVPVLVHLVLVIWDNFSWLWDIRNVGVTSQQFWEEKEDKDIIIKVQACKPSWMLFIHLSSHWHDWENSARITQSIEALEQNQWNYGETSEKWVAAIERAGRWHFSVKELHLQPYPRSGQEVAKLFVFALPLV